MTIFLLSGWLTTISDSLVVNPALENALLAWNFADSLIRPVWVSEMLPMRVIRIDKKTSSSKDIIAIKTAPPLN